MFTMSFVLVLLADFHSTLQLLGEKENLRKCTGFYCKASFCIHIRLVPHTLQRYLPAGRNTLLAHHSTGLFGNHLMEDCNMLVAEYFFHLLGSCSTQPT